MTILQIRRELRDLLGERVYVEVAVAFVANVFAEAQQDEIDPRGAGGAMDAVEDLAVEEIGERRFAMKDQSDARAGGELLALEVALVDKRATALRTFEHAAEHELLQRAMRGDERDTELLAHL